MKIIIPSNILVIRTTSVVLLGIKLRVHTDTLKEANLIDERYERGQIQNEQEYRNA